MSSGYGLNPLSAHGYAHTDRFYDTVLWSSLGLTYEQVSLGSLFPRLPMPALVNSNLQSPLLFWKPACLFHESHKETISK